MSSIFGSLKSRDRFESPIFGGENSFCFMAETTKPLQEFTNDELLAEFKKRKSTFYLNCVFVGLLAGIALYSTVRNGFGVLTFLPFFFTPIAGVATKKYKEAKAEMDVRNLK